MLDTDADPTNALTRRDLGCLAAFCFVLFGFAMISGRTLTMHEAVLPQSSREMLASGDWLVPTAGGRPWLERPPLPQWITVTVASLIGRCDAEWIVRLPPALMSTITVLVVAMTAAGWYGRGMGIVAGLMLATMLQFCRYSWLAEQDIFLCTLVTVAVAAFTRVEFFQREQTPAPIHDSPLTVTRAISAITAPRSWNLLAFFVLLAVTNLAKGLIFGPAFVIIPIAGYLLWNCDIRRILTFAWFWGALVAVLLSSLWPLAVYQRYPDVLDLWLFDHMGRLTGEYTDINEPWWYYAAALPWEIFPWTFPAFVGLASTWSDVRRKPASPERFLWCWAVLPPLVFSFAGGKHHHYLLHCLAPWAVLGAIGAVKLRQIIETLPSWWRDPRTYALAGGIPVFLVMLFFGEHLPGPSWLPALITFGFPAVVGLLAWSMLHPRPQWAIPGTFATVAVLYLSLHSYTGQYLDKGRHDSEFLKQVRAVDRAGRPLLVNAALDPLDVFKILFYLEDDAVPLHNLSFLRDAKIHEPSAYLVTRYGHWEELERYGQVEALFQSVQTRRERSAADRWTLFRIDFHADLARVPADVYISPMQAMYREDGPYLR